MGNSANWPQRSWYGESTVQEILLHSAPNTSIHGVPLGVGRVTINGDTRIIKTVVSASLAGAGCTGYSLYNVYGYFVDADTLGLEISAIGIQPYVEPRYKLGDPTRTFLGAFVANTTGSTVLTLRNFFQGNELSVFNVRSADYTVLTMAAPYNASLYFSSLTPRSLILTCPAIVFARERVSSIGLISHQTNSNNLWLTSGFSYGGSSVQAADISVVNVSNVATVTVSNSLSPGDYVWLAYDGTGQGLQNKPQLVTSASASDFTFTDPAITADANSRCLVIMSTGSGVAPAAQSIVENGTPYAKRESVLLNNNFSSPEYSDTSLVFATLSAHKPTSPNPASVLSDTANFEYTTTLTVLYPPRTTRLYDSYAF